MGTIISRMMASCQRIYRATAREATTITPLRTSRRRAIATMFWMLVTSLVSRVMREAEENRSMSPKEKVLSFSNSARRRLAPRPWAAKEACLEAMTPQYMETEATTSISAPIFRMMGRELLAMPLSMISAMSRGRISSQMVSSATRAGARTACFWYPFR